MANFSAKCSIMTKEMVDSFCESFYILAEVHPTAPGRDKTIAQFPAEKDSTPHLTACQEQTVKLLESHKAPFRRYPECFLCLVGLSPYYPLDENSYPAFEHPDGTNMGLLDFIKTADPWKVWAVEVQKGDDQIPDPTEGGQEDVAEENAYLELADPDESTAMVRQSEEEVVTDQPKKIKKKRLIRQSDVLPSKKLRTDHPSLASSTEGKTLAGLEQIMPAGSRLLAWERSATPSVAPPQESEGFVDLPAHESLQICTTVGSSSTLSALVYTAAADHNLPPRQAREDFNPEQAGPSQLEESEGSDDSFYELATFNPSKAKRWSSTTNMPWEEKDPEILRLKSQMAKKEADAAQVVRLRDQVSSLSRKKSALTAEVSALKVTVTQKDHDISLLDSRATHLESTLNDAQVACTEAGTKITSLASERDRLVSEVSSLCAGFKDFKEKMEIQQEEQAQELYNRVAELEAHVMDCLKSAEYQGILGHALGRAVDFGMQEGLEVGHEHGVVGRSLSVVDAYNSEIASADYVNAVKALEDAHFPLVDLLKSKKDVGMDEVLDCFLLDEPLAELPEAASLQPCIKQLSIPIHHAGDKTAVGETSISFALMNVHARAKGAKKHAAALRQLMMEIVFAPLSSQTWVGEASISATPLSVEDYAEEDTDKALGSVVAVPNLERFRSVGMPISTGMTASVPYVSENGVSLLLDFIMAKSAKNVVLYELLYLIARDSRDRLCFNPFGEVVNSYDQELDFTWSLREGSGYVDPPFIEWPRRRNGG
ncbi:hypothetical protein Tco_0199503 [Tanacetum coccineum]